MADFFTVSEFRRLVRDVIRNEDITVPQVAHGMHLSSRTLYNFLDGKTPSVETLDLMARYLKGGAGVFLP